MIRLRSVLYDQNGLRKLLEWGEKLPNPTNVTDEQLKEYKDEGDVDFDAKSISQQLFTVLLNKT